MAKLSIWQSFVLAGAGRPCFPAIRDVIHNIFWREWRTALNESQRESVLHSKLIKKIVFIHYCD